MVLRTKGFWVWILALLMMPGLVGSSRAGAIFSISGAGATFPYPVYAKWAVAYQKLTGIKLNYQSIGSGGGIKQIMAKTVDFGASDAPLSPDDLHRAGLIQFPMIMGGVVPVVNLPGTDMGALKMSGKLLAEIYMGRVTQWNDHAIAAENPGLPLPAKPITVVHRADGSGTTWIFTNYLSKVSSRWKTAVGSDKAVAWPTGVGGKGNEGVASYVKRIKGSIGYVEYAYALQNHLNYVRLRNRAGQFVAPSIATFQAAAANADWEHTEGFAMVLTDQPGGKSWPITGASFILRHRVQSRPEVARAILRFFDWCYRNGQAMAKSLDYVPIPVSVVRLVESAWKKGIRDPAGNPIW